MRWVNNAMFRLAMNKLIGMFRATRGYGARFPTGQLCHHMTADSYKGAIKPCVKTTVNFILSYCANR